MNATREPLTNHGAYTYQGVHEVLRQVFGPAADYACTWCGSSAEHWAYTHGDPDERQAPNGAFSLDLSRYTTLCRRHHVGFDRTGFVSRPTKTWLDQQEKRRLAAMRRAERAERKRRERLEREAQRPKPYVPPIPMLVSTRAASRRSDIMSVYRRFVA